jgi:hypothetical protein
VQNKAVWRAAISRQPRPRELADRRHHPYYDWAWVAIGPRRPGCHGLLIRRHRHTRELAFYRCYSPRSVSLAT